ncbi:MAG: HDOD domain-containing protein [Gemmatimonadaceae bacterium]
MAAQAWQLLPEQRFGLPDGERCEVAGGGRRLSGCPRWGECGSDRQNQQYPRDPADTQGVISVFERMGSAGQQQRQRYPGEREPHNTEEASPLEIRLRQILAEADFPAISKDALDALKAMPDDDASLQRLANIVLREYSLTLKVLRTANSAYFKRSGQHIQSAAHAMLLLGARTVRHLAGSLLVFDHYRKRSPGLKELMLMSMITANHARELAMLRGFPDPEEAHLAGMFRNLGEVLVAGYFPREYARIIHDMETNKRNASVAAFEVLGFVFEDLGEAMAKHWGMPETVLACIRADGPAGATELGAIVSCAHELTAAVYRRERTVRIDGVSEVMARYARRLALTKEQATAVVRAALRETKETFHSAKVSLDDLRLRKQHDAAIAELGGRPGVATPVSSSSQVNGDTLPAMRQELTAEVRRAAEPESGEDLNRVILTVLEAIYRGGPFDRVVFCVLSADRASVKARFGLGTAVEPLLESFSFDLSPRDGPIAVAMLRRQSVYAPVDRDFTAQELRFAQSLGAGSFGVFPVLVSGKLVGCVYADRPWNARLPDKPTIAFARAVCDGAAKGIAARRWTPGVTAAVAGKSRSTPTMLRATPSYAVAVKTDAVVRVLKGEPATEVAQQLAIPVEMLETWRKQFLERAMETQAGTKRANG